MQDNTSNNHKKTNTDDSARYHRINYAEIAQSADFKKLVSAKKRFIIPSIIFFMIFYFSLPISTSFFTFLNNSAWGDITWAWVFAFAQFIMTWTLCICYAIKAKQFDALAKKISQSIHQHKDVA